MGLRTESMISNLQEKLKGIRGDSMISNLQEKLKGIGGDNMIGINSTQAKLKAVGADEMVNNMQEKLKQLFLMLENFGLFFLGWLDEVLQHWLHVNTPYIVTGLILLVFFWCCSRCFHYCCCSKVVKMMKAPGRNFRMPRHVFEANPKGYFRDLHASKLKY